MSGNCPVCNVGTLKEQDGKHYSICDICQATVIHYIPQPHQEAFHRDNHTIKAIFGAYGSGKTTTAVMEIVRHVLTVSHGRTALLAPTLQLLKETVVNELLKYLPHTQIKEVRKIKGEEKIILKNGHELMLLPSDDAEKIRSLNLTAFYLEEASNSKYDIFLELNARLRNERAFVYEGKKIVKNKLLGILASNPDVGWIRTEILHKADKVYSDTFYPQDKDFNPFMSVHLHSSFQNKYLDKDFQFRLSKGKPDWWVKRYILGSFEYAEGLVYPMFSDNIVEPFAIPPNWKRMFGVDFGLRDPTVMLAMAIDPDSGIAYVYDEHYEAEKPVSHHARHMLDMVNRVPAGMINGQIIADPMGKTRRGADRTSYFDHYAEYGLWFKPANNQLESGIMKVFTYFSLGKLKVMSNCVNVVKEGREYKYGKKDLTNEKNQGEKPIDANNHTMDVLRYIINELPDDPNNMVRAVYFDSRNTDYRPFRFPQALMRDDDVKPDDWYNTF